MANSPPSEYIYDYSTNREVRILLPTQLLDPTAVGSPVGTGTGNVAGVSASSANSRPQNRVIAFGDDLYCIGGSNNSTTFGGIYKRNQSGADQWGQVQGIAFAGDNHNTGLHVLHPGGIPTLIAAYVGAGFNIFTAESTDGTSWTLTNHGSPVGGNTAGQAIVFRDSLYWALDHGSALLFQYDFALNSPTSLNASTFFDGNRPGNVYGLTIQDNNLYMAGWSGTNLPRVCKLQAGALVSILHGSGGQSSGNTSGHSCLFTDPATGDLIVFWSGADGGVTPRTLVNHIENAATTATPVNDISSTVLGAVEGADKYLSGGGSALTNRSWYAYVDNDTVPASPRVFLKTTGANGVTECWEWRGVGAEIEFVAGGAGIDLDQFSVNAVQFGGGVRSVIQARIEIGDASNQDTEVAGGRKFYFRAIGSGGPFVGTFYVSNSEGVPDTAVPITAASLTIESGSPSTTPLISGNTLTNITPDDGTVLYSIVLDLSSVSLGSGEPARLMGDLV